MYEVVKAFRDAKNDNHYYAVGDTYPVSGYKPTKARIEELVKGTNKLGMVFLKEAKENDPPQNAKGENDPPQKTELKN